MVRRGERNRTDHRRLAVVLVVKRPDAAATLEAIRMGDRPVVHLGALLLAVVHDVESGGFLEAQGVETGPPLDLGFLLFREAACAELLEQPRVIRYLQPLAP